MNIAKNYFGKFFAYLPCVKMIDPACVDYSHSKQETYQDCCKDIINGCNIEIEKLKQLRETYEKRMVSNAMGIPYDELET